MLNNSLILTPGVDASSLHCVGGKSSTSGDNYFMGREIWNNVPNWEEFYQASDRGNVKSLNRIVSGSRCEEIFIKGKILKQSEMCGYLSVGLCRNGILKRFLVHRLIALSFIPNPENKRCVNHIDGNKKNNRVENLEWATHRENIGHSVKMGWHTGRKILTEKQVLKIRASSMPTKELSFKYGVSVGCIYGVRAGINWKNI